LFSQFQQVSEIQDDIWGAREIHKVIEGDFSIWKPLAWKINFALQGSFYMSYNG
jgi:hypothetical protein